jgi:alpha-beta hydrolase superfamily lysophospholipase
MTVPGDAPRTTSVDVRSFESGDGLQLYYHAWDVEGARGVVRIIHGLGEHGARYLPLAEAMREHGIASYAIDLRGHGVSGGVRGHLTRFDEFIADVERFTAETASEVPAFLLGHSLGGLIALRSIETGRAGRLAGAILSTPALRLAAPPPPWLRAAAAVLSRVAPEIGFANDIDPADLSRDPEAVAAYRSDPLIHDRITPRLYIEMRKAMRAAAAEAPEVEIPVLLLAPGDDRIAHVPTALAVASRLSGDVQIRSYPGFYHEALNDRGRETVISDIIGWLEEKLL